MTFEALKRYMITFYDADMGKLGRYPYYDYVIGCVSIPDVLEVLLHNGVITPPERDQMIKCKCIMIEEDN